MMTLLNVIMFVYITGACIAALITSGEKLTWRDIAFGLVWPYIAFKLWARR